jgi:hypothetical protein
MFSALPAVILNLFQDLMGLGVAHLTSPKQVESGKRKAWTRIHYNKAFKGKLFLNTSIVTSSVFSDRQGKKKCIEKCYEVRTSKGSRYNFHLRCRYGKNHSI